MRWLSIVLLCAVLGPVPALAAEPVVEMKTNLGAIRIELFADKAPKTAANFLQYVKDRYYDGLVFHRVIDGFMIQGGGYTPDLRPRGGTRAPIANEAGNGLKNRVGTIAMARTSDPNSATAQFFINVADNPSLDYREPTPAGYGYAVFGRVQSGMDVVMRIAHTPTGPGGPFDTDVPRQPVVIESVRLIQGK